MGEWWIGGRAHRVQRAEVYRKAELTVNLTQWAFQRQEYFGAMGQREGQTVVQLAIGNGSP